MTIQDILATAVAFPASFQKGLSIVLPAECVFAKDGVTIMSERPDSHGLTFAGLNQKDDELPVDETGTVTATPEWIVQTYWSNYWKPLAVSLPEKLNWVFFVQAVNEGEQTCVRLLQLALNDAAGLNLEIDGLAGEKTLAAVWKFPNAVALAMAFLNQCTDRYRFIASMHPDEEPDLEGWLHRVAILKTDLLSFPAQSSNRITFSPNFLT